MLATLACLLATALAGRTSEPATAHVGSAITVDGAGRVYFIDTTRDLVWRLERSGALEVVAEGIHANAISVAVGGALTYPPDTLFQAVAWDGSVFRAASHRILRVAADGSTSVFAGDSLPGYRDGPAHHARFARILGLAVDSEGRLLVVDYGARSLRRVDTQGMVASVLRSRWPWRPTGVAVWNDEIYILERWGDYYFGPSQLLTRVPGVAGLVGHPRVRRLDPDSGRAVVASIVSWPARSIAALLLMLVLAAVGYRRKRKATR